MSVADFLSHADDPELHEKRYRDFEERFLHSDPFWRVPIATLSDPALTDLLARFVELFPDHPNAGNTVLYVQRLEGIEPLIERIYFVCLHFEHSSTRAISHLVDFLRLFGHAVGDEHDTCGIELLDSFSELLILNCDLPSSRVVELLKQAAGQSRRVTKPS